MPRHHRPFETPTPAITDPVILRQMAEQDDTVYQETTMCDCGCDISTRHLERHRRSKKHMASLMWVRQQGFLAMAQHAQRVSVPQVS